MTSNAYAEPVATGLPKLAVMPLQSKRLAKETTEVLDELLVNALHARQAYQVIAASDINSVLGLEQLKSALGCDDVSCAADIGGALGADLMLTGSVGLLAEDIFISLTLVDIQQSSVKARAQLNVKNKENLFFAAMEQVVTSLTGISTPTDGTVTASRPLWPYLTLGTTVVGAGLGTLFAIQAHGKLQDFNNIKKKGEGKLDEMKSLEKSYNNRRIATAVSFGVAGAAAIATVLGFVLWEPDAQATSVAVLPMLRSDTMGAVVGWSF